MFEFIRGIVVKADADVCVLDVNGVGFKIQTPGSVQGNVNIGETFTLYTYMAVKEDDISLYGFCSYEELSMFKLLISVSGIGPKGAMSILDSMSSVDFSTAVITGDHKTLSKVKGIGPKTAQRIVLELKDKIKEVAEESVLIKAKSEKKTEEPEDEPEDPVFHDTVEALMVLGYDKRKANEQVKKVYKEGLSLEEAVKAALRGSL